MWRTFSLVKLLESLVRDFFFALEVTVDINHSYQYEDNKFDFHDKES
jgi:hypothetical protein